MMPGNLAKLLPFLDDSTLAELFGSIYLAARYPLGDPIRTDAIQGERGLSHLVVIIYLPNDPRIQPIARG